MNISLMVVAIVVLIAIVLSTMVAEREKRTAQSGQNHPGKMKCRWTLAPPQPLLAGQLAVVAENLAAACPVPAQPRLQRTFRHRSLSPAAAQTSGRPLFAAGHGRRRRSSAPRPRKDEPLVIFGDYDVDGVTSTALLVEVLRTLGWQVDLYLPNRMDEGYGLSAEGAENCLKKFPVKLLLAVDCGSTAVATIASLHARGVEVIVLDHHQVSSPAPAAVALVNPQLSQNSKVNTQNFVELCSAGLAFKLAHALVKRGREISLPGAAEFDLRPLLDLVALGTIADLVPLTGENRILVTAGSGKIKHDQRAGIIALKQVAQSPEKLGTQEVGFQLAPRLNAAGRLEKAEESLRLLLAKTLEEALPIAGALDLRNRERQKIEKTIVEEVIGTIRSKFDAQKDFVIVEGQLLWHIGVVGIVASRVVSEFYRPTIIIGGENGEMRGSGRSIAGFDLAAALRECDDLLLRHGGHAMAAGLSLLPEKIDLLRQRLNGLARNKLKPEELQPPLRLDAEVGLAEINFESLVELEKLKPVGQGNPNVQFCARSLPMRVRFSAWARTGSMLNFG